MDTDVMPAAPVGVADEEELRKQRLLGVPGTVLNHPQMPPAQMQPAAPVATKEPLSTSTMPPAQVAPQQRSQPMQATPTAIPDEGKSAMATPAMPPPSLAEQYRELSAKEPKREDFPAGKLPMWRKILGSISAVAAGAGSHNPALAGQLESDLLNSPQAAADKKFGQAQSGWRTALDAIQKESGLSNTASEIERRDAETAKIRSAEDEPKPHDVVKDYSDALAAGDEKKAADLAPKVRQFIEDTQKPQKEPTPNEKEKDIADYLEANKLPNTAGNREKARFAIAQRSKTEVNSDDAKEIANAIARGEQPPTTTGLYRNAAKVRAELGRAGFNLAKAESDWHATQKHLATLNGAQQERLRQAVSFTSDSLGIIEGLYDEWKKTGVTSGWKTFNKASLATAKQLPGNAGNIAHRLEAQINDLTSELGTVYKGGNSSTDESLKLAAGNLAADWNEKTFKDAIDQIRQNLTIRQNSIKHSQPAGVSENSPYTPQSEKEKPKTAFTPF